MSVFLTIAETLIRELSRPEEQEQTPSLPVAVLELIAARMSEVDVIQTKTVLDQLHNEDHARWRGRQDPKCLRKIEEDYKNFG